MIFELKKVNLNHYVEWCKIKRKKLFHEELILYLYLGNQFFSQVPIKKRITIEEKALIIKIPTIRTSAGLQRLLESLRDVSLLIVEPGEAKGLYNVAVNTLPYPFIFFKENISKPKQKYLAAVIHEIIESTFLSKIDSISNVSIKNKLTTFTSLENVNVDILSDFIPFLLSHQKEISKSFFKKDSKKTVKISDEDFNFLYPYVQSWNSWAKKHTFFVQHSVFSQIDPGITLGLSGALETLKSLRDNDFSRLPFPFQNLKGSSFNIDVFKATLKKFAESPISKSRTSKITLKEFLYNPAKDFSWFCKMVTYPQMNYKREDTLKKYYAKYDSIVANETKNFNLQQGEIIVLVNALHKEFLKIKKTVGWFYSFQDSAYPFNNFDSFTSKHISFLKSEYGSLKLSLLKPILNDGSFSKSYNKFCNSIADTYEIYFYPSPKEMKIHLQLRALKLSKKGLLSKEHHFLTDDEFKRYREGEIQLLYEETT